MLIVASVQQLPNGNLPSHSGLFKSKGTSSQLRVNFHVETQLNVQSLLHVHIRICIKTLQLVFELKHMREVNGSEGSRELCNWNGTTVELMMLTINLVCYNTIN